MRNSVATSSKVAQMASIFQTPGPGPDPSHAAPSVISRKTSADISSHLSSVPGVSRTADSSAAVRRASKVSVSRTESHHERFSSARALFERMGSGDNLLEEGGGGSVQLRSPRSSVVTSPSGSRTSSISISRSISERPGSRTDSESGVSSSRHSVATCGPELRSRSSSPLGQESRSSSVSSTAELFKNGLSHADHLRTPGLAASHGSPNKHPPDKPERKINAKEAISKQRNWFSNFEKSKTGPESVDSARRTSVNKENKPSFLSGSAEQPGSPARTATVPLSPNHQTKSISPKTSDSIEAYMQNWKKSPTNSKSDLW